jgi:hypothetical protein
LRKYLIVAVAALAALVFATTASVAQTVDKATMKVSIKPKKAGTKKKPKNSSIELTIENANAQRTLNKLTITAPKTFVLSAKGLPKCDEQALENQGPSACPKASKVGGGEANAMAAVNSASPTPLTFTVTAFVLGPKKLGFYLAGHEAPINVLSPGTIKGRKLIIQVPQAAQQLPPGTYNGLVSIHTTLKAKKGKHYLASTIGCKNKKHKFSTALEFVDNTVTTAKTLTTTASSKCTK